MSVACFPPYGKGKNFVCMAWILASHLFLKPLTIKLQFFVFVIQLKIQSEESEEIAKFKELFPDMKSPDSLYDKSPVS